VETRTSTSHPLILDIIDLSPFGIAGKLGMTFAPGKDNPGRSCVWARDLEVDLHRLRQTYGVDTLVCLVEAFELAFMRIPQLSERTRAHGMAFLHHPVVDVSVPGDPVAFRELVADVAQRLRAGEVVAVHCRGGLGRTGLTAACVLVAFGMDPEGAIHLVRQVRPRTIETRQQEDYVRAFTSHG
jgi:hypothetical protein